MAVYVLLNSVDDVGRSSVGCSKYLRFVVSVARNNVPFDTLRTVLCDIYEAPSTAVAAMASLPSGNFYIFLPGRYADVPSYPAPRVSRLLPLWRAFLLCGFA